MARKIFVAFFLSFAFISVIGPYVTNVDARTQKMLLQTRTQLRPVAWPEGKGKPWFAPGPYWVDEFERGVQSGTLDMNKSFEIYNGNGRSLRFGRGLIRFERSAGGVKEGTLASDTAPPHYRWLTQGVETTKRLTWRPELLLNLDTMAV